MMDIEKLIERLEAWNEQHLSVVCGNGHFACDYLCENEDCVVVRAATALSTLQTENEKLREAVDKYATAARVIALHLKPFCDESLPYDEMIADAARKASDELEQVKRERDAAVDCCSGYCASCLFVKDCAKHDMNDAAPTRWYYGDCEDWEWRGWKED